MGKIYFPKPPHFNPAIAGSDSNNFTLLKFPKLNRAGKGNRLRGRSAATEKIRTPQVLSIGKDKNAKEFLEKAWNKMLN